MILSEATPSLYHGPRSITSHTVEGEKLIFFSLMKESIKIHVCVHCSSGGQRKRKLSRSGSICLQPITFIHLFALGGIWEALFLAPPLLGLGCLSLDDNS